MGYNYAGLPTHDYTLVVYIRYAMITRGLPDIYTLGLRVYISSKPLMLMVLLLHIYIYISSSKI